MVEVNGEATLEEDQEFTCPHCGKKFKKLVSVTGEVCLDVEFEPHYNEGYD